MDINVKILLLISFVMFIPMSAACYFYSRHAQRHSEVERYLKILNINDIKLFEHQHPIASLSVAVLFVTFLSVVFWGLVLFGNESGITGSMNYLLGGTNIVECDSINAKNINYQAGALLTFNMAFLGAYLWGIQNIARRYSMNDLIPAAYYNVGVRMIFACILALVFYHLSKMIPDFLESFFIDNTDTNSK